MARTKDNQYSPAEQHFWQSWGDYWARPKDCEDSAIESGISPYCRFRDWLNQTHPPIGMETLDNCLRELAETFTRYSPRLQQVRAVYEQKTKRTQSKALDTTSKPALCTECDGTGLVYVTSLRETGRKTRPIGFAQPSTPGSTYAHRPIPCMCTVGAMMNDRIYGYPDWAVTRLFDIRTTSAEFRQMVHECMSLSGASTTEERRAPEPTRKVRTLSRAGQAMGQRAVLENEYPDVAAGMKRGRETVQTAAAVSKVIEERPWSEVVADYERARYEADREAAI